MQTEWRVYIDRLWIPFEFILLTWAPNLLILPLSSIQAKEDYENAGQLMYNEYAILVSFGFFVGMGSFFVCFVADMYNREEPWPSDTRPQKVVKYTLLFFRF